MGMNVLNACMLELRMVVSHHLGAGNQSLQYPLQEDKCSLPLTSQNLLSV